MDKKIYDLIIIGGGPGGIASAVEAAFFKIPKVLLIEKGENHSQTIRMYYKDSKRVDRVWKKQKVELLGNVDFFDGTKESTLDHFEKILDNKLIDFQYKTEVDSVQKEGELLKVVSSKGEFMTKNTIVAIGKMGKPNKPPYKIPLSLKKLINHNPYECKGGEKILVIGGGDSAVEYACQLTTENEVTISHRDPYFSYPNEINIEMINRYENEGKLKVLHASNTIGIEDENGKPTVFFKNGSNEVYDRVILAIGGTTPVGFMQKSGIEMDENKMPVYDENFQTNVPGLYIAGDIVFKHGGSIAMAINHAYGIVKNIANNKMVNI